MRERADWNTYYKMVDGREPRPLLLEAMAGFDVGFSQHSRQAIDLGCGSGTETAAMLAQGWHVLAIDAQPAAIERLKSRVQFIFQDRLSTQVAPFEQLTLPPADLIYAGYSLPFCLPEHFDALWEKVTASIQTDGRFAGQLFGVNDTWAVEPDMTFHTEERVRALFAGFEIEHFHEMEEDGYATDGPKHWHVFSVIARKL